MPAIFPTLGQFLAAGNLAHSVVLLKPNGRKVNVSDRALRYRAKRNAPKRSRCYWCGVKSNPNGRPLDCAHINGFEDDNEPENLGWSCRSCNVKCGRVLAAAGEGRSTHQYNPPAGAQSLGQWMNGTLTMTGDLAGSMSVPDAVAMVRATPSGRRHEFAEQLSRVRTIGNPSKDYSGGAKTFEQWLHVVNMMRSGDRSDSDSGYAAVMATDPSLRKKWNARLLARRWSLSSARRKEQVPF